MTIQKLKVIAAPLSEQDKIQVRNNIKNLKRQKALEKPGSARRQNYDMQIERLKEKLKSK